jgi:hypothetical protein
MIDDRLHAPAVARNRDAIVAVLREFLPRRGLVLEIGSGSGEHVVHFAEKFPLLTFQPSDIDPNARASVDAWVRRKRTWNVEPAVRLDATRPPRPVCRADAILCIDMAHAAPWAATEGLFYQAYDLMLGWDPLFLYGPFLRAGVETPESLRGLDATLRTQNPEWGLRDLDAVIAVAQDNDFLPPEIIEMPDHRLSLIFRRM